ncbi:hypothetical protein TRFO_15210 [Tritrichomonas foetus]|uniref:Uncharacterized protein n=1 Tax=Tritrichomonas foetus TaxID=1144522 RepID=A0A1J4KXJ8_9EUKA|nr:hypothetical protein TRFO_15210 [Tritrichomonas foetus]|eukprot:OHT14428.1 hypothetical protein TRFO_15210 [Tritrichomonas foetus]
MTAYSYIPLITTRSSSFSDTDLQALEDWSEEERKNVCLTIWVDSMILRIAICPAKNAKKAIYLPETTVNKVQDVHESYEGLHNAFARYHCQVVFSTMSFAGPVSQDHVVITNWSCEASDRVIHFASLPFDLFPLDRRMFMNDLEAASYGLLAKYLNNTISEIFVPLWNCDAVGKPIVLDGSSAVVWIGDGFGVSYICRNESSEHNCVVSSESGHGQCFICAPTDPLYELEYSLIKFVSHKIYAGSHQPEWEDLNSLRGCEIIYRFLKQKQGIKLPEWPKYDRIRSLAINNEDPDAELAFRIHYRFILRSVQSCALGIQCQRMFIISEYHVKNMELIYRFADDMKDTFEDHPRADWFRKITVYSQCKSSQFALSGGLFLSRIYAVAHQNEISF